MTLMKAWSEFVKGPASLDQIGEILHSRIFIAATDAEVAEIVDRCHLFLKLGKDGHRLWKAEVPYEAASVFLIRLLNQGRLTEAQISTTAKISFLPDFVIEQFFMSRHMTLEAAAAFTESNHSQLTTRLYNRYVIRLDVLDLFNQG